MIATMGLVLLICFDHHTRHYGPSFHAIDSMVRNWDLVFVFYCEVR